MTGIRRNTPKTATALWSQFTIMAAACIIFALSRVQVHAKDLGGVPQKSLLLAGQALARQVWHVEGHTAFVIMPRQADATRPMPWVWYAPTLPGLPEDREKWMFERFLAAGMAIAGVDVGESYGSPQGRAVYSAFYKELVTRRGFAEKACLLARSRGGLMLYNWACENPEAVACVAGIYPVCDIRSFPGLERACGAYGLTPVQLEAQLGKHNPIDRLQPLAKAGVPIFHIHGDSDTLVPLGDNSGELARHYRTLGGQMQLQIAQGQGHNLWEGYFQCQELVDFVVAQAAASRATGQEPSPEQFQDPPMQARPSAYWDWLNGNVDLKALTSDLEQAKAKGMGGLQIWDVEAMSNSQTIPAGAAFLSDKSVAAIRHALAEGRRLGMRITLEASSGWNAGGAWVAPDWALKRLCVSSLAVKGPARIETVLPFPVVPAECPRRADGLPQFYREVAVLAVPQNAGKNIARLDDVVNLTALCKDGRLTWTAPAGEWVVLRFVCSNLGQRLIAASPNSQGLFIDFLEPSATERHFKHILDRLGITPQNAAASGLFGLEVDSMEMGPGIPWTDRFPEYFRKWCGYDPLLYIPILADWKIEGATDAFQYDFKKAVSQQLIYGHYAAGRDFLRRYGLRLTGEAGGPGAPISNDPVDSLLALGHVSIPRGEFWVQHRNIFLVKDISSAAHIYGLTINEGESFTTWRRWKDSPFELKRLADRALCEGLNRFTFHTFAHSPPEAGLPGRAYHAGSDINPRATWWEQARPFIDYLSRCSYLLQQGHFVADVCVYYGDQSPNAWPAYHDVPQKPLCPGLDAGYDYDVVNSDVILNRMRVADGRIVLPDGMSYRLLVLPNQDHIPAEVLEKIAALVQAGATIVGPKPTRDPRLADQVRRSARVREAAEQLWGSDSARTSQGRSVGRGKVFAGMTPAQVLAALGVPPDFLADGGVRPSFEGCSWVWYPEGNPAVSAPPGRRFFRRELPLPADRPIQRAVCRITCDNDFTLFVNGRQACASNRDTDSFNHPVSMDITSLLKAGPNQLAIEAVNTGDKPSPAGLLGCFVVKFNDGGTQITRIDKDWKTSNAERAGWTTAGFAAALAGSDGSGPVRSRPVGRPFGARRRSGGRFHSPAHRRGGRLFRAKHEARRQVGVLPLPCAGSAAGTLGSGDRPDGHPDRIPGRGRGNCPRSAPGPRRFGLRGVPQGRRDEASFSPGPTDCRDGRFWTVDVAIPCPLGGSAGSAA